MSDDEPTFLADDRTQPSVEEIRLPIDAPPAVITNAIQAAMRIAMTGLVIGLVIVLAGVVVLVLGVTDAVTWKVSGLGGSSELQTGATGVVIAIIGLGVIFITRMNVRVETALKGK